IVCMYLLRLRLPVSSRFPYTTLFRSFVETADRRAEDGRIAHPVHVRVTAEHRDAAHERDVLAIETGRDAHTRGARRLRAVDSVADRRARRAPCAARHGVTAAVARRRDVDRVGLGRELAAVLAHSVRVDPAALALEAAARAPARDHAGRDDVIARGSAGPARVAIEAARTAMRHRGVHAAGVTISLVRVAV